MMNSKLLFNDFMSKIKLIDSKDELETITSMVLEDRFNLSRTDILSEKKVDVSEADMNLLDEIIQRINSHEPVQYILGKAEFYGRLFNVNSSVLIPRPETELLIHEVLNFCVDKTPINILDIGTGSGCISVTLSLELKHASVFAIDISDSALYTAKLNASDLKANVSFIHLDIFSSEIPIRNLNVIVSNPPYITVLEKDKMSKNVLDFEPHVALFVPENDPLLFYKVIITKAKNALKSGGLLCVEINQAYGNEVAQLFYSAGFLEITIIKDLDGKDRIVKGVR